MKQIISEGLVSRAGLLLAASILLNSCGNLDRDYRLRFWEKCRITAEQALHKRSGERTARSMAEEAVYQAQGFGDSDFRLGVSYCDLGDALKLNGKNKEAEEAYKRALAVLEAAEAKDITAENESVHAHKLKESETNELMRRLVREDKANTLSQLADLYALQERNTEAANCFEQAANIYQSMLGKTQWSVDDSAMGQELVQCELGLAQVSIALKSFNAADVAYKKALEFGVVSNCPEFTLREIRDAYLALLQQLGRQDEAKLLSADALYSKATSEGTVAMFKSDFTQAEQLFRTAYAAASQSIFSDRRLMRALFNLQWVFTREQKFSEMENTFVLAKQFMHTRGLRYDRDYDQMLTIHAKFLLQVNRAQEAATALEEQLRYRIEYYGPRSIPVCETMALQGQAQLQAKDVNAANRTAKYIYDLINSTYLTNRRAKSAMESLTYLESNLGNIDQAEKLDLTFIDFDRKMQGTANGMLIGHMANLFVLYSKFQKHEKALALVKELAQRLDTADPVERAQAMPYVVLILSYSMAFGWFDVGEPVTVLGQSIMSKDIENAPLDAMALGNWTKDVGKMEAHFGHKF